MTPEEGDRVRFTQKSNAFYITTLYLPNNALVLESPVPYVPGDQITVVGGNMTGTVIPSKLTSNGSLQLTINEAVRNVDQYSWVFKISFGELEMSSNGTSTGSRSSGAGLGSATARGTAMASATGGSGGTPATAGTATGTSSSAVVSQTTSGAKPLYKRLDRVATVTMLGVVWLAS